MPYVNPGPEKNDGDISTTMSSTLPMAAVRIPPNLNFESPQLFTVI